MEDLKIVVAKLEEKILSNEKALELARGNLKDWQNSANEWRQAMIDQRNQYVTKDAFNVFDIRLSLLEKQRNVEIGKSTGYLNVWMVIIAIMGIAIGIIGILFK